MEPDTTRVRRVARVAIVASIGLHLFGLWGLRASKRPAKERPPPLFAIDVVPAPPKAEALAPEIEDRDEPTSATATAPTSPDLTPPPPPAGFGLVDAGVPMDAALAMDAAPRRRADAGLDGGLDAGVDAMLVAELDGGTAVAAGSAGDSDGGLGDGGAGLAGASSDGGVDGGAAVATGPADGGLGTPNADLSGDPTARVSPGAAADLRIFFPTGHEVSVLVRLDRLRDTEWAPRVDAIFAPMPDYRALVGDSGVALTDTFETLAISTPEPSDATATTLVVRGRATPAALRDLLDADDAPVAWSPVQGGALGRRGPSPRRFPGDRRVFLQWKLGWTALAQPADLGGLLAARGGALDVEAAPAALPRWLQRVSTIELEAGEPTGPVLIATASNLFPPTLPIPYGSGGDLPGPDRATIALELDRDGLLVRSNVRFPDEAAAVAAAELIDRLRTELLADRMTAFALGQVGALHAIEGLTVQRTGRRLTLYTSISKGDTRALLTLVSTMVDSYFTTRRPPPPP